MLTRRLLITFAALLAVVGGLAFLKYQSISGMMAKLATPKPPISVSASAATAQDWQYRLPAIGTLTAAQGVEVSSEVNGTISQLNFESGQALKKGQLIVQLDDAVERASLATAQAELKLAQLEFTRGQNLVKRQTISRSEFDALQARLEQAKANVAQLQATLAKKAILAPFDGQVGIRKVDLGQFLSPGTSIATLQDLSVLYVDFFLPEQDFPKLSLGQTLHAQVPAYPDKDFIGHVVAINPKVEDSTRNLEVRAAIDNPSGQLLPGMFARLNLLLAQQGQVVVVPETAITYSLYGDSVYVVSKNADNPEQLTVERLYVTVGERRDGVAVIEKGLQGGETVVTAGQLKLDNGSHVTLVDDVAAHAE